MGSQRPDLNPTEMSRQFMCGNPPPSQIYSYSLCRNGLKYFQAPLCTEVSVKRSSLKGPVSALWNNRKWPVSQTLTINRQKVQQAVLSKGIRGNKALAVNGKCRGSESNSTLHQLASHHPVSDYFPIAACPGVFDSLINHTLTAFLNDFLRLAAICFFPWSPPILWKKYFYLP